jgi:hypothetical protein
VNRLMSRTTLAGLALVAALAMPGVASAALCPPGSNNPAYCASIQRQISVIERSARQILSSYKAIRASTLRIDARVKGASVHKAVNGLLAKAARAAAKAEQLLKKAKTQSHDRYAERATVATARREAATARAFAAQARLLAARALISHG